MLMIYLYSESETYGIEKNLASRTILILDTKAVD